MSGRTATGFLGCTSGLNPFWTNFDQKWVVQRRFCPFAAAETLILRGTSALWGRRPRRETAVPDLTLGTTDKAPRMYVHSWSSGRNAWHRWIMIGALRRLMGILISIALPAFSSSWPLFSRLKRSARTGRSMLIKRLTTLIGVMATARTIALK